jgi:hypothetical protein
MSFVSYYYVPEEKWLSRRSIARILDATATAAEFENMGEKAGAHKDEEKNVVLDEPKEVQEEKRDITDLKKEE